MSESLQHLTPDALFVVACPVCLGHVAAMGGLCGRDVCCPLCASLFHVPFPGSEEAATVELAPEPEPAGMAEDWGSVITQLAPPRPDAEPSAPPQDSGLESFESLPAEPTPSPAAELSAESTVSPSAAVTPVSPAAATEPAPGPASPAGEPAEDLSRPPRPEAVVPDWSGPPVDARVEELVFTEPVRTVRQGDRVIEIRRLSPEERRSRRVRRNLMMIVVGISILLAIVLLFGVPKKP
jgi:hypothetical protein